MAVLAVQILQRLLQHQELAATLQFTQVQRFLDFTKRLWPEILSKDGSIPIKLPPHISAFLSSVLGLQPSIVELSWVAFSDIAATFQQDPASQSMDDGFRLHGHEAKLGPETLAAPFKLCPRPGCNHTKLTKTSVVESRLYTLHRGVLPVFSKSSYCETCLTRYYPNYSVFEAQNTTSRREYYSADMPIFIHVTESSFIEPQLCSYFANQMALSQ
ncbi:hypothetical protein DFH09DRAFT_1509552 [Mycena vulgaris]|nr:hypothetical protein DFH09DRAFT_1351697 [Mycena vulgaris]KAJ6545105.1 hypothetical protein DFH09DRAFT_1509552 [Mycena vulgaris]